MWHRAGGIRHSCIFHFCNLLIQAAFRSALLKDGGGDCAHDIINVVAELTRFMEALVML